jgi:hypothetical protein
MVRKNAIALTNSVSQISGDAITKRPVSNIQQAFQGLMPGVTVLDQGGSPGKSNTNIRVRGITTFNINGSSTSGFDLGKNDALVIVDGIEQRLSDINPDDIETVFSFERCFFHSDLRFTGYEWRDPRSLPKEQKAEKYKWITTATMLFKNPIMYLK